LKTWKKGTLAENLKTLNKLKRISATSIRNLSFFVKKMRFFLFKQRLFSTFDGE
jgi:hypothetical protein